MKNEKQVKKKFKSRIGSKMAKNHFFSAEKIFFLKYNETMREKELFRQINVTCEMQASEVQKK